MALIAMAVYDTTENNRSWMTEKTLTSLSQTVNWKRHRLFVSDNGSCPETHAIYQRMQKVLPFRVVYNGKNLGTAVAINKAWRLRNPEEHAVKMDNDVVCHQADWADWMEDVFARAPHIGIVGLKRKDLAECPWATSSWYRSKVRMLPHQAGQRWLVVEEVLHVMGTCQAYSSKLLDQIGFLYQMQDEKNLYGFDDSLASLRSRLAGFKNVFLHGFEIDHIDPGNNPFITWKQKSAGKWMRRYNEVVQEYQNGTRSLYYEDKE